MSPMIENAKLDPIGFDTISRLEWLLRWQGTMHKALDARPHLSEIQKQNELEWMRQKVLSFMDFSVLVDAGPLEPLKTLARRIKGL